MAVVIGIDPGTACTGIAVVEDFKVRDVRTLRIKAPTTEEWIREAVAPLELLLRDWALAVDLVVVEGQQIRHGSKAPPGDIIKLANIAGGLAGIVAALSSCPLSIPKPEDWKGQTKKPIDQARTYNHFGWGYTKLQDYAYP